MVLNRVAGLTVFTLVVGVASVVVVAQRGAAPPANKPAASAPATPAPVDYVIGVEDVLTIVFWREKDMSADVIVRPDGKISLPLLNDVQAAGLTPLELGGLLKEAARKYVRDTDATVVVKEIHSRKIFVIGEVAKPGAVQVLREMTVLQAIGEAGGFSELANKSNIVVLRMENGRERRYKFNYNDVVRGKKGAQNIPLRPGDTIIVR
jgi:polysaccharide export outer membrane protein